MHAVTHLPFIPPLTTIDSATNTTFFVVDAHNTKFVFKYHSRTPMRAIHDALGAHVGKSIDIAINEVEIFSDSHALKEFFDTTYPLKSAQI